MVQIIKENRKPSFGEKLNVGVGRGLDYASQLMQQQQAQDQTQQENKVFQDLTGMDISGIQDPKTRQEAFSYAFQGMNEKQKKALELQGNTQILNKLEEDRGLPKGSLAAYSGDPKMGEIVTRPPKPSKPTIGAEPVPKEISRNIKKILADNPKANADELRSLMDEAGIPPTYSNPYTENRRRTEEQVHKEDQDRLRALRAETLPVRTQIANKAMAASHGIQNKEQLLDLVKKGDINDPTYAALAEALPLNLGKRLLSNDTVEYKAGLIEEFGDLKNLFPGQVRVKEIELLEQKIADLYLTDSQKEAILKSRINALKADQIRAEVAQELENEPYGVLQFQQELEKRVKPKLEALFNRILDEQKAIIQDAENKKKIPLDFNDPEDKKIAEDIIKEAGGNRNKARELAKKKGYSF